MAGTSPPSAPERARRGTGSTRWRLAGRIVREAVVIGAPAVFVLPIGTRVELGPGELAGDIAVAVLTVLVLLVRRRAPLAVLTLVAALLAAGLAVSLAAIVALLSVAVRSTVRRTAAAALLLLAGYAGSFLIGPDGLDLAGFVDRGAYVLVGIAAVLLAAVAGVGLYLGARRQLLASAQERAERAEAEQQLLAERARVRERARIAREMHDVLAHRLSMLALHAGALEYRAETAGDEVARAAGVVRENAHEALQELRDVLGVLRAETETTGLRPQPTLDGLTELVEEAAQAGQVGLHVDGDLLGVPTAVGRAAYRIVQEGLTNARRHAPGARVDVQVAVTDDAVAIEVRNGTPTAPAPSAAPPLTLPGRGTGLVGAAERVELLGGTLAHGPADGGGYLLSASLPLRVHPDRDATDAAALHEEVTT